MSEPEEDHVHDGIDYVEPTVPELAAARRFYSAAFGWDFADYGPTCAGIRDPSGREVGGLAVGERPGTGGPLVLLCSADLDATAAAVTDAGGRVGEGPFPFPGGRRFHVTDPGGTELGVWALR